ncbi:MAG: Photosystem I assembly protein Ycf3 [Chlamydiae bacterium]|nr:Photosystem I assembly protein Ycf3 [Chlamydiota bacterium]
MASISLLHGESGVGKTELTIQFAHQHRRDFSRIYRIDCSTDASIHLAYITMARDLHLYLEGKETPEGIRRAVNHRLANHLFEKPWLLILDNMEKPIEFPEKGGMVLITAINENVISWQTAPKYEVKPFSEEETITFLQSNTKETNIKDIKALHQELNGLPFLLGMAIPIIELCGDIHTFLQEYKDKTVLLEKGTDRHEISLGKIWQMLLEKAKFQNPNAFEWLSLCAYLNSENIPRAWIEEWLQMYKSFSPDQAKQESREIVRLFSDFKLIHFDPNTDMAKIHNLLQKMLQKELEENISIQQNVLTLLDAVEQFDLDKIETWEGGRIWLQHALSLLNTSQLEKHKEKMNQEQLAIFYSKIGDIKDSISQDTSVLKYVKDALKIRQTLYPNQNHPDLVNSLHDVGIVYRKMGDAKTALKYLKDALEMTTALYPNQNRPDLAGCLDSVGLAYLELGDAKTALKYLKDALEMTKALYPNQNHPDLAFYLNNMGMAYKAIGDAKTALKYLKDALEMAKALNPNQNHPDLVFYLNNMGMAYLELGDAKTALKYLKDTLEMTKALYPNQDHYNLANSLNNMGMVYLELGDAKTALKYLKDALEMTKALYPNQNHFFLANALNNMGMAYKAIGDAKTALKYLKDALEMAKALNPNQNHPFLVTSLDNVGVAYETLGDAEKALKYYQKALDMAKMVYDEDSEKIKIYQANVNRLKKKLEGSTCTIL